MINKNWLKAAGVSLFAFMLLTVVGHAQSTTQEQLAQLEQTEPIAAADVPRMGLFYSAKLASQGLFVAILPGNLGLPAWSLGDNVWLVDDLATVTQSHFATRQMNMDASSPPFPGGGDGGDGGIYTNPPPMEITWDTNQLWLEVTNVSNGLVYLNAHHATNSVFGMYASPDLTLPFANWTPVAELWPTNDTTNTLPFSIGMIFYPNQFVRAMDWTGLDSDKDGIPDWWAWIYWGTNNVPDTNLDYSGSGRTFAQDYSNNITPTVFSFTGLSVTNNYVKADLASMQLNVAGTPYYLAVSVDDPNFQTDASWQSYAGSNLLVNLGMTEGWHTVYIGLRGHGDDPIDAIWQAKRLKLDITPPALFITNPTNPTGDIPLIQLQGFSPEALSHISYDLTNAAGLLTNQPILVLNQTYDTNSFEFTTNTFQAYDVTLTNGVNTFIFHATDLAGNTTTASYNLALDYSAKTNPPPVQITWPLNGTEISGSNFTIDGQVHDATVTVAVTITDSNGHTNTANGLVERSGKFWVQNLPLNGGTNTVALTATDVAGNVTTTNFNVVQSPVTLTVNPVTPASQLWQPTVNLTGGISDATYAVWVNGVKGHNNGNGTWSASNVPVDSGGTASFTATAYAPNEQQPDGSYGN